MKEEADSSMEKLASEMVTVAISPTWMVSSSETPVERWVRKSFTKKKCSCECSGASWGSS